MQVITNFAKAKLSKTLYGNNPELSRKEADELADVILQWCDENPLESTELKGTVRIVH